MSHDNTRFNISGDNQVGLVSALNLYATLHQYRYNKPIGVIDFTGYSIHPNFGMILYQYEGAEPGKLNFPFDEGKDSIALASFFYNYLKSPLAQVKPLDEPKDAYERMNTEEFIADMKWDADSDHDGSNGLGWRLFTGKWGKILGNYKTPLAIRPCYCWYGK
jgi:hypothetical protein